MYGMTNSGRLFSDDLIEWLLEAGLIQSQCQMSIYYKYAPDGSKIVVLSYVYDCVYWYTYVDLGRLNQFEMFGEHENYLFHNYNNVVMDENSAEVKPCINR